MGALLGLLGLAGCPSASGDLSGDLRVAATWVTVPQQLSPRAGTSPTTVSYWLEVNGRPWVLRLRPRRGLVSCPFTLVTYGRDGARWEEHPFLQENCFYQGEVQGSPGSLVALSACGRGLHGILWVEDGMYEIKPIPGDLAFQHMLYRMEEASDPGSPTCGLTLEEMEHQKALLPWFRAPQVAEEEEMLKDWWRHVRYVKLVVVVDNVWFVKSGRNDSEVLRQVIEVINIGDSLYQQLSIRLFLVGLELWTKSNLINVTDSISKALDDFNKWRKSDLSPRMRHDTAHLFTFQSFGRSLGLAFLGSMCDNQWSSAVASFTEGKLSSFITTLVHELGHTLGMHHDEWGCKCRRKKCIMYKSNVDTDAFSDCSYKDYFDLLGHGASCIHQPPAPGTSYTMKREYCGNKIESGEQCDCGSESNCKKDPCCRPNCKFTAGSVCASGKYCQSCQVLPAGTLCRAGTNDCDLPEYCNGTSPWCPPDVYVQDGTPCKDGAYCYRGKCPSHSKQCQHLFGKQARAAPADCFKAVNTQGDWIGNCGIQNNTLFKKCSIENILCGRIQCENLDKVPFLQNHVTVVQTPVGGKKCWGLDYHSGMPTADVGAVEDGTPCGIDKLCINRTCTSMSLFNYDCNMTMCRHRGACNNCKNCHCRYGWAPPYCEWKGFGGSVDSGPPPARMIFHSAKPGIIVCSLFICVLGITLAKYYQWEIVRCLRRKKAQFCRRS